MQKPFFVMAMLSLFLVQCGSIHQGTHTTTEIKKEAKQFTVKMDGSHEVPPKTTTATGSAVFTLNAKKTELAFDITVADLSGPVIAAHLHNAPVGVGGAAVFTIPFTGNKSSGVWKNTDTPPFTPEMVAKLEARELFVNVHTALYPTGEIRGQLIVGH